MNTRISLAKGLTLTVLTAVLATPGITVALADAEPTAAPTSAATATEQSGSINWGIRPSFVSYVGGHYSIEDGATEANNIYTFPTTEVNSTSEKLTLKGKGKVRFIQYCSDRGNTDTCQLDFAISDPTIVIDPAGESYLSYTVRTRNYQTGQVEGPQEIKMATLNLTGATQTDNGDGTVSWKNISTSLTEEGAHAFSNFYDTGTALASLDFTYTGVPVTVDDSAFTIAESWNTELEYSQVHKVLEMGDKVVHFGASSWGSDSKVTVLDAKTMKPLSQTTLNTGSAEPAATDGQNLYIYNTETGAIDKYTLDAEGKLVASGSVDGVNLKDAGTTLSLGYNPASKTLAALTIDGSGSGVLTFVDENGKVTSRKLPDPATFSPKVKAATEKDGGAYTVEYYGDTFSTSGRVLEPTADGSFIYAPQSSVYDKDGEVKLQTGYLLKFSNTDTPVSEVAATISEKDAGTDMRGVKVAGDYIVQWNQSWGDYSAVRVLKFNGTDYEVVRNTARLPENISSISGITYDGEHFIVGDAETGTVYWMNENMEIVSSMNVPNMRKTDQNNAWLVNLSNGDIIVPTMIESSNYQSEIHLVRLAKKQAPAPEPTDAPEPVPTSDPTVEPTAEPTADPTAVPSVKPTAAPSVVPSVQPSTSTSAQPSTSPSATVQPTTAKPSVSPSTSTSAKPDATASASASASATPTATADSSAVADPSADSSATATNSPGAGSGVDPTAQGSAEAKNAQEMTATGSSEHSTTQSESQKKLAHTGASIAGVLALGLSALAVGVLVMRRSARD